MRTQAPTHAQREAQQQLSPATRWVGALIKGAAAVLWFVLCYMGFSQ